MLQVVGLVLLTIVTVAAVAYAVIGLLWVVAFVLRAITSPTELVAASSPTVSGFRAKL